MSGAFILFVVYEAVAMVSALAIYLFLAATRRVRGAGVIATAIVLNLAAAGVQATSASVWILFPFDHNGLFHIRTQTLCSQNQGLSSLPSPASPSSHPN